MTINEYQLEYLANIEFYNIKRINFLTGEIYDSPAYYDTVDETECTGKMDDWFTKFHDSEFLSARHVRYHLSKWIECGEGVVDFGYVETYYPCTHPEGECDENSHPEGWALMTKEVA